MNIGPETEYVERKETTCELDTVMSRASNPYGDGHASERIADALAGERPCLEA